MTSANPMPLWQPDADRIARARITRFQTWAAEHHGAPSEGGYAALHRWSVDELDTFWRAVTEWFDVRFATPYERVLGSRSMPGATWFPGATLNYAEHALRAADARADEPAVLAVDETLEPRPVSWSELRRQVGSLAAELRALGGGGAQHGDVDDGAQRGQFAAQLGDDVAAVVLLAAVAVSVDGEQDDRFHLLEAVEDAASAEVGGAGSPDCADGGRGEQGDDRLRDVRQVA
ncbi:MAG: hypothetical protein LBV60_19865, partial [Streptomyces sp.]|nr:hypothetical protein [Streptomyces sp.]